MADIQSSKGYVNRSLSEGTDGIKREGAIIPVEFIDKTGQPRTSEELEEALDVVNKEMIKADFSNPTFFLQLPIIRDALRELLGIRQIIKKLKEEKREKVQSGR